MSKQERSWPLFSRPHERAICLFYALSGTAVSLCTRESRIVELGLAITWSSFILAISFMEAWVKFRAPFLPKHIAVDVGRHVFASLQAAELGLCGSLWFSCLRSSVGRTKRSFLLELASVLLLGEALWVAPKLYLRAKARIVEGFQDMPPNAILLNKEQEQELNEISRQVNEQKDSMPSRSWHALYAVMELVKVVVLNTFVVLSWKELA